MKKNLLGDALAIVIGVELAIIVKYLLTMSEFWTGFFSPIVICVTWLAYRRISGRLSNTMIELTCVALSMYVWFRGCCFYAVLTGLGTGSEPVAIDFIVCALIGILSFFTILRAKRRRYPEMPFFS